MRLFAMAQNFSVPLVPPAHPGIRKACDVWYRALTNYFSPVTDYYEARTSTVKAAQDLFPGSSKEAAAVAAAWDVVGAPDSPDGNGPRCDPGFAIDSSACPA
jgi:Zn-dependent metalloprotease